MDRYHGTKAYHTYLTLVCYNLSQNHKLHTMPTAAVLCPWARHFTPWKYWLITQEAVAPSRYDWKIVDWDVKLQYKQTKQTNKSILCTKQTQHLPCLHCYCSSDASGKKFDNILVSCIHLIISFFLGHFLLYSKTLYRKMIVYRALYQEITSGYVAITFSRRSLYSRRDTCNHYGQRWTMALP